MNVARSAAERGAAGSAGDVLSEDLDLAADLFDERGFEFSDADGIGTPTACVEGAKPQTAVELEAIRSNSMVPAWPMMDFQQARMSSAKCFLIQSSTKELAARIVRRVASTQICAWLLNHNSKRCVPMRWDNWSDNAAATCESSMTPSW